MLKALSTLFFGALVVCVFALILWTSLDFQECIKNYRENDPAAEYLKKSISVFVGPFPSYRHCVGAYVTDKNAVITAIGTLVIAVFTTVLGIFTMSLAKSTRVAADAAKEAAEIAPEEFISTHRPKIIIHSIDAKRIPNITKPEASEIDRLGAILLCVNKGRSSAVNSDIRGATMASKSIPDSKIQRPVIKTVDSLESGIKIWTEIDTERSFQELVAFKQPIYFVGTIAYFDKNENRRETGFCYVFDLNSGSWRRTEGKGHNYAY